MMAIKTVTGRNRLIKYRIQSYIYQLKYTFEIRQRGEFFRNNSCVSELEMIAKVFFPRVNYISLHYR